MNAKEWAERLNGREYRKEITHAEEEQAAADGVVVVFGQSDDLIEFRGVIDHEDSARKGGIYKLTGGKDVSRVTEPSADMCRALPDVRAVWCPKDSMGKVWTSWLITASFPAFSFDIWEDGEMYCRGLVFAWTEAYPTAEEIAEKSREAAINDFRMDELDGVMVSVDKWLTGDQLKNNPATRAADAREVALKAIEKEAARADLAEAERDTTRRTLEDHGPEGHNVTNQQFVDLRNQRDELLTALNQLVHLHLCEQEGLESGKPSPEDWLAAVEKASAALAKAGADAMIAERKGAHG